MTAAHKAAIKRGIERAKEARLRAKSENANLRIPEPSEIDKIRKQNLELRDELLAIYRLLHRKEN